MAVTPVPFTPVGATVSAAEEAVISAAYERIGSFERRNPAITTLLPSDPYSFCAGIRTLSGLGLLRGRAFCDFGSGVGLTLALAALNGFDAFGIEIEPAFVAEAEALCAQFALSVRIACGSFVSREVADAFAVTGTYGATDWTTVSEIDAFSVLGKRCSEMDLIYAYPWPREVALYETLFDLTASSGALLWLYRQGEPPKLLLKV